MKPIELVLGKLERVRRVSGGWMARCPAHEDRHPTLQVSEGQDDRVLLHCFAGCSTRAVLGELGLEWRDLFQPREGHFPLRRVSQEPSWNEYVRREEADYFGPGGEPRKKRPPLQREDFDSEQDYLAYESWRQEFGHLKVKPAQKFAEQKSNVGVGKR